MDKPRDYHTKWNKSEQEGQITYSITYKWNLKYNTNEHIYETERLTDIENRLVDAKKGGAWVREGCGVWISRCKQLLIYTEYTNNEVLLYSTGNYMQYTMINHNGKEYF